MEILSTGEKIKRARIYQGVTLKELCGDKISISKMSCIENGKIKADEEVLLYIANKLDMKFDYLVQDVKEQIIDNLALIKDGTLEKEDLGTTIEYNLNYAREYSYYDLAFQLIHKLFNYYMDNSKIEGIQNIISEYYDLFQMNNSIENMLIYYRDMASFFMINKEYNEAINYYQKIMQNVEKYVPYDKETYTYSAFNKGVCYMEISDIKQAYAMVSKAISNIEYITNKLLKGKIYHIYANLNILLYKVETDKYLKLAYEYQKNDKVRLANSKGENAKSYFVIGEKNKAKDEIREGIKIFKTIDEPEYVEYLIYCIDILFYNFEYDFAMELLDEALDLCICSNDERLVERAYYFKGMILQKKGQYLQAEMYMNLSTDKLLRFANKEERFKRYNEMGELYYNLNELKESIKYFTLAMNLEKKL